MGEILSSWEAVKLELSWNVKKTWLEIMGQI
jgi:hypothetical protein